MFEWLFGGSSEPETDITTGKKELDVTTGVWYDEDSEKFLVGYGFQNRVDNLGLSSSLSAAVEDLSRDIGSAGSLYTKIRSRIQRASECSLEMTVYHRKPEEEYIVELTDGNGGSVSGVGHNMSSAFEDLAEQVPSVERSN